MSANSNPGLGRRLGVATATMGAAALVTVSGVAAASSSAATGERGAPRAGSCATNYVNPSYVAKYGAKQQTIVGAGEVTEPEFSLDGRKNKRLAYVLKATDTTAGTLPGVRNVFVATRIGEIKNDGGPWQRGGTTLISAGQGGPANGDSWHPSLSGFTGKGDAAKGPSKMAFLSKATNLPGGNPTGVSAYVANAGGGGIKRLNVPGSATGVGISGDSKVFYVTTDSGIFIVKGGKAKKLASGSGFNTPTTTLNGAQAAYGQNGSIYTITAKGKRKKVAEGSDPQADAGFPGGGRQQGLVRAVSFHRGGTAYKLGIIASPAAKGLKALGRASSPTTINGGGSAVAFGNGTNACLIVQVLDSGKTGGYDVPQGQCPDGRGDVTDVGVSTRYNYLAFSCSGGGLHLYHVGGK
jgi:hypothetical protein